MKKFFTFLMAVCAMSFASAQTVPNASFEDWTDANTAVGWSSTFNVSIPVSYSGMSLDVVLDYKAATRYADGHTGTYSAKLTSQQANAQLMGYNLYSIDLPGVIQLGNFNTEGLSNIDFDNLDMANMDLTQYINGGIAFDQVPAKITAWVAYYSPSDTMRVGVLCTRWNNGTREIVAQGDFLTSENYEDFTQIEVPVTVKDGMEGVQPDTLNIIFSNASGTTCDAASVLTIDDVAIQMEGDAIYDLTFPLFSVRPNPATDVIMLTPGVNTNYAVRMYDTNGKRVWEGYGLTNETEINVNDFTPGVYFLQIQQNGQVKTEKVIVK